MPGNATPELVVPCFRIHWLLSTGFCNYYLIPKNVQDNNIDSIENSLMYIRHQLEDNDENIKNIKEEEYETKNLKLDYLFWVKNQKLQEFVIIENISDVSYKRILNTFEELDKLNSSPLFEELKFKPSVKDLYWNLFPNNNSHHNPDSSIYRKEFTQLFSSLLKGRTIDYQNIINKFMNIFRLKYLKKENKNQIKYLFYYSPTKMNILFSWMNRIANLEGGFQNMEGNSLVEIENKDIQDYFSEHKDIYESNYFRQGLFLLGYLMNQILKEQKDKKITVMNKLNFDGIPVRRVGRFMIEMTEQMKIYDVFQINHEIYSAMTDRLQGIEESKLTKNETVFYILSGISYGRYLGNKYAKNKSEQTDENE